MDGADSCRIGWAAKRTPQRDPAVAFGDDWRAGIESMLTLLPDERTWLDRYREAIRKECPDAVRDLLIYGSKARGDAHEDSDIDMLVIVKKGHDHVKNRLTDMADDLAVTANAAPSAIALTEDEWGRMKELRLPFQRNVERDAVSVLSGSIEEPVGSPINPVERGRARKTHGRPDRQRAGSPATRTGGQAAEERPMNKAAVLAEWGSAADALIDTRVMREQGRVKGTISRAYYAIMHAARAALLVHDVSTSSHEAGTEAVRRARREERRNRTRMGQDAAPQRQAEATGGLRDLDDHQVHRAGRRLGGGARGEVRAAHAALSARGGID